MKLKQLFTEQNNGRNKSRILLNLCKQKIATFGIKLYWNNGKQLCLHVVWGWHFAVGWYRWRLRSLPCSGTSRLAAFGWDGAVPSWLWGWSPWVINVGPFSQTWLVFKTAVMLIKQSFVSFTEAPDWGGFLCVLAQEVCPAKVFVLGWRLEAEQMWFSVDVIVNLVIHLILSSSDASLCY